MAGSAVIVGVGPGLGAALARRFAATGYKVAIAARNAEQLEGIAAGIDGAVLAVPTDARDEAQIAGLFDRAEAELGPVEVAIFNPGANYRSSILDMPAEMYEKVWRLGAFAGFVTGREAARRMVPRGAGTILFTGATASMRGAAGFAAFAGAKFALRALAQSMARELGPQGVHVAHIVIDGGIDTQRFRERFPDRIEAAGEDGLLMPDHIAEAYYQLHAQPRSAWTHEIDLRPHKERF